MRFIHDRTEPDFWKEYKRNHRRDTYNDLGATADGAQIRSALREHLVQSQNYLCAYCCKQIETNSALNEHIKPKGVARYTRFSMDYDNLIASCITEGKDSTCGARKGNQYNEALFISPLQEDCNDHFSFAMNGEIIGTTEKGRYMIDLLNLNSYRLKQARAATIKACFAYPEENWIKNYYLTPDAEGKLSQFADMIEKYYQDGFFSVS